jgi:osmotically-inducible protein OsmY
MRTPRFARALLAAACAAGALAGCAPLLVGTAAVGSALMVTDRRTSATQLEDQSIELKSLARIRDAVGDRAHVNVTSYNRVALITGEAPSDADRTAVEKAIAGIEGVKSVVNELGVMPNSSLGTRSNDTALTTKVKATFIDAKDVHANAFKVVTERGVVHLMGRVTERESNRAAELARGISGVQKVVRVFDILSEEELASLSRR